MDRNPTIPKPPEEKEVLTLLHHAVWEGKTEVIPFLLAHGFSVNVLTNRSMTPVDIGLEYPISCLPTLDDGTYYSLAPFDRPPRQCNR